VNLDRALDALAQLRAEIADANAGLAHRELDARLLRITLEEQLRRGDEEHVALTKTDAEKAAKVHPDYLAVERETIALTRARDVLLARAEVTRFVIERELAVLGTLSVSISPGTERNAHG
jgi:hypothetical protein